MTAIIRRSFLFLSVLLICCFSCSSGPPEISQVLVSEFRHYNPQKDERATSLAVFAKVNDPDGLNDLNNMWIISDQEQLLWGLGTGNWQSFNINGGTWVGSVGLNMPVGESFPRGNLRVQIEDRAGNRVELAGALGQPGQNQPMIPILKMSRAVFHVEAAPQDRVELSVKDWSDNNLSSIELTLRDFPLESVAPNRKVSDLRFYLYSFSPGMTAVSSSGPWLFK